MSTAMQGALFGADVPYQPPPRTPRPRPAPPAEPPPVVHHAGQLAAPVVPVRCTECHRLLRDPVSITENIGPVCKRQRAAALAGLADRVPTLDDPLLAGDDPA